MVIVSENAHATLCRTVSALNINCRVVCDLAQYFMASPFVVTFCKYISDIGYHIHMEPLYCTVTQGALVFSRAQYLVLISYTNWFTVVTVVISSPFHRLCWLYLSIRIHEELRDNIIAKCSKFGTEFHSLIGIGFRFKLSDWSCNMSPYSASGGIAASGVWYGLSSSSCKRETSSRGKMLIVKTG